MTGLLPASAQLDPEVSKKATELAQRIGTESDFEEKLKIFHSEESTALFKQVPLAKAAAAYSIAERYINEGDKNKAVFWMSEVKPIPLFYDNLLPGFFKIFQDMGEDQFVVDYFSPEMDSLYTILKEHKDKEGVSMNTYIAKLPYFLDSKLALKQYDDAERHLEMIYKYCGNIFINKRNYYQYVKALLGLGQQEKAITMFAKYKAEKTDFSSEVQKIQDLLVASIANGEAKFQHAVDSITMNHRKTYKQMIGSLNELNGINLPEKLGSSKYILLSFWGTWCAPCTEGHPKLIELYNQYKQHGLEVLGIAQEYGSDIAKMEDDVRSAIDTQKLPWLQTMIAGTVDKSSPIYKYIILGYPTKILVDIEGTILGRFEGLSYDNTHNLSLLLEELMGDDEQVDRLLKIKAAKIAYEAYLNAQTLSEKVALYVDFAKNQGQYIAEISAYKDEMLEDIAIAYVKKNDIVKAKQYQQEITNLIVKNRVALELIAIITTNSDKVNFIQTQLDNLLVKGMWTTLPVEHTNIYSRLVNQFIQFLPKSGSEDLKIQYLENAFSYNFFIGDLHASTSTAAIGLENTLTYAYAKALSEKRNYEEVAKVLASYLNAESNYNTVRSQMLLDFKEVPDLSILLDKYPHSGHENYRQLVSQLLLKEDIDGKVNGNQVIKDKYFLVDFWGSWCIPCRAGHPHLKELYAKYKDSGFEIIALAAEGSGPLDIKIKNWKTAVQADGLPWIQLLADDREGSGFDPVNAFQVKVFPTKILFDKKGEVIAIYDGGDDDKLDAKLKEIFGK